MVRCMSGDSPPSWSFRFMRMNFYKCCSSRFFGKWGNFWGVQHSSSIWKMKLLAMLLHPRAYSHTYFMEKILIYFEGDPESVPPFAPHQLFRKFGALAFPSLRSGKSEKKSGGRRQGMSLSLLSFITVFRTVSVSSDIQQIRRK